jgi:hypothetical protein
MSESNLSQTDSNEEERTANSPVLSRRTVLNSVAVSGALLGGMGVASGKGQGGQGVVHEDDFRPDGSFVITEVSDCPEEATNPDGSCWAPTLYFQCNGEGGRAPPGKGGTLPFPYWTFQYYNDDGTLEDTKRKLYTRDNKVRTGVTYHWPGQAKECPQESGDVLVQTGFSAGGGTG